MRSFRYSVGIVTLIGCLLGAGYLWDLLEGGTGQDDFTFTILFENAGWDAMSRSYKLAKPYAWAIVGVLLRMTLVGLIVIVPLMLMILNSEDGGGIAVTLISVLGGAALAALYAVAGYMIYLRLRDLSGTGADVSNVFR